MGSHFKSWTKTDERGDSIMDSTENHADMTTIIAAYEQRKNDIRHEYREYRKKCNETYEKMQDAWAERVSARERLVNEYKRRQRLNKSGEQAWAEYINIRDVNNALIAKLKPEADSEHRMMHDAYEKASLEREHGNRHAAMVFSTEGRAHQEKRSELNDKISELAHEISAARQRAETRTSRNTSLSYKEAKEAFEAAKAHHEKVQKRYKKLKAKRNQLRTDYDLAKASYDRICNQ